jgi:5-bromo-4-chloroindolyl phosphate hydrolysis protein
MVILINIISILLVLGVNFIIFYFFWTKIGKNIYNFIQKQGKSVKKQEKLTNLDQFYRDWKRIKENLTKNSKNL